MRAKVRKLLDDRIAGRKPEPPPAPPVPPPLLVPTSAKECRQMIAEETVAKPYSKRLRPLFALLRTFEGAEKLDIEKRRLAASERANKLAADALAMKKADYKLRFVARDLGQRTLLKTVARLEAEVATLKIELGRVAA